MLKDPPSNEANLVQVFSSEKDQSAKEELYSSSDDDEGWTTVQGKCHINGGSKSLPSNGTFFPQNTYSQVKKIKKGIK